MINYYMSPGKVPTTFSIEGSDFLHFSGRSRLNANTNSMHSLMKDGVTSLNDLCISSTKILVEENQNLKYIIVKSLFNMKIFVSKYFYKPLNYNHFKSTQTEQLICYFSDLLSYPSRFLNSRSSHFVFLGAHENFKFLFNKYRLSGVILLNSIEGKHSRFINGGQFHLIVFSVQNSDLRNNHFVLREAHIYLKFPLNVCICVCFIESQ